MKSSKGKMLDVHVMWHETFLSDDDVDDDSDKDAWDNRNMNKSLSDHEKNLLLLWCRLYFNKC